ncbi:hypothetical protein JKF63_01156 [Porcisia hertigi]|uniref:Uncharacterized protein n=1 Tax=Porcisia hertigi TaxID=2761500 RepID=A0A836L0D6_9TRYP|nr:hypothetical protein JKF63_01156 [Porcisia hertigi]
MDLDFSNRGLFAFDAAKAWSTLIEASVKAPRSDSSTSSKDEGSTAGAARPLSALPAIRLLNLSYNSLHLFTGGEVLKGLTILDLSYNSLTQLNSQSMPPTLVRLSIAHNQLTHLCDLAEYTPRLQVLEAGHNHLSTSALRDLPKSLTHLNVENNTIESLTPLGALLHITHLHVARNQLESRDTLCALQPLVSLRHLDIRGNPICEASRDDQQGEDDSLGQLLRDVLPRLSHFNGASLSQAPGNPMWKVAHRQQQQQQRNLKSSALSHRGTSHDGRGDNGIQQRGARGDGGGGSSSTLSSFEGQQHRLSEPTMEIRLMQAKVSELRRLLLAAQDAEGKARQKRTMLMENVKSTAKVIDQQEAELNRLQSEVESLRGADQKLQVSVAAAEQSFEQVHASVLASKAKLAASGLR